MTALRDEHAVAVALAAATSARDRVEFHGRTGGAQRELGLVVRPLKAAPLKPLVRSRQRPPSKAHSGRSE